MSHIFVRSSEETLEFSFLSTFGELIFYLLYFNNLFNLHQMYQGKTEESEYMRIDPAEHFAFSFMYCNTQFRKKKPVYIQEEKGRFIILGQLHWSIQNSSCTLNVPMFWSNCNHCNKWTLLHLCMWKYISILFLIGMMKVTQSKGKKGRWLYNTKLELEEIKEMKKGRVDLGIKSLTETPDNLCLKADSTGKLTCVTQASLLKKNCQV